MGKTKLMPGVVEQMRSLADSGNRPRSKPELKQNKPVVTFKAGGDFNA